MSAVDSKKLYNIAERDAYRSWVALHGPVKGGQKGFRAILRERGMKVPHHYAKRAPSPQQATAERRFVEQGLGRQGHYTAHRYPEASEAAED